MKIAFIDNTCNHGYTVTRYLNDKGYDVDLFLLAKGGSHTDPLADTILPKYADKIRNLHWDKGFWKVPISEIRDIRNKYDFIFAADWIPGLFYKAGKKLDAFIPHGTDLFEYPFMPKPTIKNFSKLTFGNWLASYLQRRGINKRCRYLVFDETNEENEKHLKALGFPKKNRFNEGIPTIYYPQYFYPEFDVYRQGSKYYKQLLQLKSEGYFILFHHCQHIWKNTAHTLFYKGNDKLIRAFGRFVTQDPSVKIKLVMIEIGQDLNKSKDLINELGIRVHILWLPVMHRNDIMACLSLADIGAGEFGHSWYLYNVLSEFLCMGVPAMHRRDDDYFISRNKTLYPAFSAADEMGIESILNKFVSQPAHFKQTGKDGQDWFIKHTHMQLDVLERLLQAKN